MKEVENFETMITLMEFSENWFTWLSPSGKVKYISPGVKKITGYNPEEFLKNNDLFESIINSHDREKYFSLISGNYAPAKFRITHRNGSTRWIEQQVHTVSHGNHEDGRWIMSRDITESVQTSRNLSTMTKIVEQSAEAIAITDISGNIEYVNTAFEEITGYSLSDAQHLNIPSLLSAFGHNEHFNDMRTALLEGQVWRGQNIFHKKDGTPFYLDSFIFPLKNKKGEITNYIKMSRDITDIKKTEAELKESEAKNRAILNLQPDLIFIQKRDGTYLDVYTSNNDELYVSPEQFLGKKMEDIFPGENTEQFLIHSEKAFKSGGIEFYEYKLPVNGQTRHFEARIVPFGKDKILSIVRDVTEKVKREHEQLKYRKLESVGLLAGGIAHDFNNIITGVLGNIELAKLEFPQEHSATVYLQRAMKGLMRATGLTKQLLTFARGGDPVLRIVDLEKVIRETVLFHLSGSNVRAVFHLSENLWYVRADKGQMEQVLSNLTINAKQAMKKGGTLSIEARNWNGMSVSDLSGQYVEIVMRDEGEGIPEKYVERIFDPYFSTKHTGSGLGLATVYSIIAKHKGKILVSSEAGKGTVFTLYLPAAEKLRDSEYRDSLSDDVMLDHIRVLVMDDEDMVRSVAFSLLRRIGCDVDCVTDGEEALSAYKKAAVSGKPYDVIFMDLTIPGGMGGKETVKQLLSLYPEAKVIVTSGYSIDPVMAHFEEYGFKGCVVKPFSLGTLKNTLLRILS